MFRGFGMGLCLGFIIVVVQMFRGFAWGLGFRLWG